MTNFTTESESASESDDKSGLKRPVLGSIIMLASATVLGFLSYHIFRVYALAQIRNIVPMDRLELVMDYSGSDGQSFSLRWIAAPLTHLVDFLHNFVFVAYLGVAPILFVLIAARALEFVNPPKSFIGRSWYEIGSADQTLANMLIVTFLVTALNFVLASHV